MSSNTITPKHITFNNERLPNGYIPNSLEYTLGYGETKTSVVMDGNNVRTIHTENFETKISNIKLDVKPTGSGIEQEMVSFLVKLKKQIGLVGILVYDTEGIKRFFSNCSYKNDINVKEGQDGMISLEFEGDPVQL